MLFTFHPFVFKGDWDTHGCYKDKEKKFLKVIFGKFRIAGKVDKCKEAAERLGLNVFGVGVRIIKLKAVTKSANVKY